MKLSLIILNYNSAQLTDTCLQKIYEYAPHVPYEVVVVDNASENEDILSLQEKWIQKENLSFIHAPKNRGYGQGNELGTKIAKGEYLCLINPDIELYPGALDRMVEYMDNNRDIGILGPQLIYPDGVIQDSYRRFPTMGDIIIKRTPLKKIKPLNERLSKFLMWKKDPEAVENVDWLVGACMMIRKSALKDLKSMFDPAFFLFFEDTDLCRRMWEQGWRVTYFPKAKALHHHQRLSDGGVMDIFRKKTVRIHIASGIKYFTKYALKKNPRVSK